MTSRDGTRIGYLEQGTGPGIVLVQGAMADARAYSELAEALSPAFTVLSADRRGRGLSPRPYDARHDIARDVEDVEAVLAATGARCVFGLSSGAVIALEAARTSPLVARAAVYEPPFYAHGISRDGIRAISAAIERGDLGTALVESLRTAGTAPAPLRALPRPIACLLGRAVLAVEARRPDGRATLRELLPGVRYDFHDVAAVDGRIESFASIHQPVLLISGTTSPDFLRQSVRALASHIDTSRLVELEGLGHDGPWNRRSGGQPTTVAAALGTFFSSAVASPGD